MLKLIYEKGVLLDAITCKVCGILRGSEKSCIILVQNGKWEGSLWTVCRTSDCVQKAILGKKGDPPTVRETF